MCLTATVIGLALAAGGTAVSVKGQMDAADAQKDAEKARKKQMALDVQRRRRELIRESLVARGLSVNNAAAQGASDGTGLVGGLAQISGTANLGIKAQSQNLALGNKIFDANAKEASAQSWAAFGSGVSNLGGTLMNNNILLDKVGKKPGGPLNIIP